MGLMERHDVQSVANLGCGPMILESYIRTNYDIEEIVAVDMDEDILDKYHYRVAPTENDSIFLRDEQLTVSLFKGDFMIPDKRFAYKDCVVGMDILRYVELSRLPEFARNIFDLLQPKHVLTAPIAEVKSSENNWTALEFRDFCYNTAYKHRYEIMIIHLEEPPSNSGGYDTQIAFFTRNSFNVNHKGNALPRVYKFVYDIQFPMANSRLTIEEKIKADIIHSTVMLVRSTDDVDEDGNCAIPIKEIAQVFAISRRHLPRSKLYEIAKSITAFENVVGPEECNNPYVVVNVEYGC